MKKIALLSLTAFLAACSSFSQPDVSGTYRGTLTCADCEKIDAELILNQDNSYRYNTTYHFKKKQSESFSEEGQFSWSKDKQNIILLENSVNLPLLVSSDSVEFCDKNGHPVTGKANYKLLKVAEAVKTE